MISRSEGKNPLDWVARGVVASAGIAAFVVLFLYAYKVWIKTDYSDFLVYHRTALRASQGEWSNIYSLTLDGNCPYRYLPLTLPFFRPLAMLPYDGGRLVWYFLQYACFAGGFVALERVLKQATGSAARSRFITALALLFSLRFCLDSFMIGQVTGTMFLCVTWALGAALNQRPARAGAFLVFPAMLKVGPALLFGAIPGLGRSRLRTLLPALGGATAVALALSLVLLAETSSVSEFSKLFVNWKSLLGADSSFFDASHYGSQSIKSALLRASHSLWFSQRAVTELYWAAVVFGCSVWGWIWTTRVPVDIRSKGSFFGLGVWGYLLFMPFTFKYSIPLIALPVAFLLAKPLRPSDRMIFLFSCLMLPLAGPIFMGETVFFFLQKASLPLIAMLLLTFSCTRDAWMNSVPKWRN